MTHLLRGPLFDRAKSVFHFKSNRRKTMSPFKDFDLDIVKITNSNKNSARDCDPSSDGPGAPSVTCYSNCGCDSIGDCPILTVDYCETMEGKCEN